MVKFSGGSSSRKMRTAGGWLGLSLMLATVAAGDPPRVLYSNDATNLAHCPPPGLAEASVPARLEATVAEAAGADVHLLQPGNGWVPWWRSRHYSADEHTAGSRRSPGGSRISSAGSCARAATWWTTSSGLVGLAA